MTTDAALTELFRGGGFLLHRTPKIHGGFTGRREARFEQRDSLAETAYVRRYPKKITRCLILREKEESNGSCRESSRKNRSESEKRKRRHKSFSPRGDGYEI